MNTYRITGKYKLWSSENLPREAFNCIVIAETTEAAIKICKDNFQEAEIITTILRDENILKEKEL